MVGFLNDLMMRALLEGKITLGVIGMPVFTTIGWRNEA